MQIMVAELLRLNSYPTVSWFHPENEGKRSPREGARAKAKGMRPGVADLIILCRGKAIAIELKPEKGGRHEPTQKAFQADWEAAGGDYYLCKGYEETVEKLEWLRIIKPVKGSSRFEPRRELA